GIFDFSAATGTAAFKVPSNTSNTASANAVIDFDTSAKNYHIYQNSADAILAAYKSGPTNGQCATWVTDGSGFVLGSAACAAGTVTGTGTSTYLPYWTGTSSLGATADFTFSTHTLTMNTSGLFDMSGATGATAFKVPVGAALVAGAQGVMAYNTAGKSTHF